MTRTGADFTIGSLRLSELIDNEGGFRPNQGPGCGIIARFDPNSPTSLAKNRAVELWSQEKRI